MTAWFDASAAPAALSIVVKASLVLGLAAMVQWVWGRRASAATRHLLWMLAVAGVLLLPAMSLVLPAWNVAMPAAPTREAGRAVDRGALTDDTSRSSGQSIGSATAALGSPAAARGAAVVLATRPTSMTPHSTGLSWATATIGLYVAGVVGMLLYLVIQHWSVRCFARRAKPVDDGGWTSLLAECAQSIGVHRHVRLLRDRDHRVPVTFGVRRPSIVIPDIADTWSDDRRRAVILHELAHVARYDCLTQTVAWAACTVYWFHPAAWWVARRLRIERELACDDRVIAAGTQARDYAGHLLEIAYSMGRHRAPALAVSMARPRQLEGRLLAALDQGRNRRAPGRRLSAVAAAIAAAWLIPLAMVAPARVAAAADEEWVATTVAPAVEQAPNLVSDLEPPTSLEPLKDSARRLVRAAAEAIGVTQDHLPGTWEMRPTGSGDTVHLRLVELNSSSGTNVPLARLEGLTAAQLTGSGGPIQFRLRRDAGTFVFEGVVRNRVGAGTFSFTLEPGFAAELAKRGFRQPTEREQYQMARHDIGYAFLDELARQGYTKPETAEIVRAGQHGVDATYLREMGALGYRLASLRPLIELRDHGVTPAYVRELADLGYKNLPADEIRRVRDHGITPEYVRGMREAGYGALPIAELVNARDHGVTPEFVRELKNAGYDKLPLEQVIRTRDHGVTPEYVRDMRQLGHALPLDTLVRARDHGLTTSFVRDMAALAHGKASIDALIRVRDHGVTPEYARELNALGYEPTLDELVALRDHGLTPNRIRAANARAGTRLPIDLLRSLAAGGLR